MCRTENRGGDESVNPRSKSNRSTRHSSIRARSGLLLVGDILGPELAMRRSDLNILSNVPKIAIESFQKLVNQHGGNLAEDGV